MAQTIKLRRSATQGGTPTVSQLSLGEVAINTYDGKMYIKKDSGSASIVEIGGGNLPLSGGSLSGTLTIANTYPRINLNDTNSNPDWSIINANGLLNFYDQTNAVTRLSLNSTGAITFNQAFTFPTADGSANQVLKTDGSGTLSWSSASAITHVADADGDTKIQVEESADEDKIRFDTAGVERMIIDATGNVGIGTTSPSFKLDVAGNARASYFALRSNESAPSESAFIYRPASGVLGFGTGTVERMRIDSSGNLGIGISSLSYKLHVSGTIGLTDGVSTGVHALVGGNYYIQNTGAYSTIFQTSGTERMRIDASGNVGIGTSTPSGYYAGADNLVVHQASGEGGITISTASDTSGAIYFADGTTGSQAYQGGIGYNHSDSSIFLVEGGVVNIKFGATEYVFNEAGVDRDFRVESDTNTHALFVQGSDGNVGIGTTSPSQAMHIKSTTANPTGIGLQNSERYYSVRSHNYSLVFSDETVSAERMRIDSSGNVLVGKSSTTFGTVGVENRADGRISSTRSGNTSLVLNRLSSDGDIVQCYKDGAAVGGIGTVDGDFNIYASASGHKGLRFGNGYIAPTSNSTTVEDATTNLGLSTHRFKDLYLSGGVYGGGAFSAGATGSGVFFAEGAAHIFRRGSSGSYAEFGRFDTIGNLLVGKTTTGIGTVGHQIQSNGTAQHVADGRVSLQLNRLTSDGDIIDLRKDGTTVGSIGVDNGDNLFLEGKEGGLQIGTNTVYPHKNGASSNGVVDLGAASAAWKDLYLSGGVRAAKLQVEALGIDTTATSTTATTQVAIDSMVAATFRSARYTIQVTNSTDGTYHLTEMLLIHDGTTPSINEFGTIYTGSAAEAVFTADINSGNVRILATPASTDAMAFKVVRHSITV